MRAIDILMCAGAYAIDKQLMNDMRIKRIFHE